MADIGNFDTIDDTESKQTYLKGEYDNMFRTRAPYRDKLRREVLKPDAQGRVMFPVKLNGMWSGAMTADNAALPVAQDPTRQIAQIKLVSFTTAIQVGLQTSVLLKDEKGSFSSKGIVAERTEDAAEELASLIDRVYSGSNRGRLAVVEADGVSTFTAKQPWATTLLEEGMRLEAYSALLGGSLRDSFSNHRITAIDRDTRIVTYISVATGAADDRTLVAGDSIFIAGTYAQAPVGLPDIADDGTLKGTIFELSRTTYPKMKGVVFGNGGVLRAYTPDLIMSACDRIRTNTNQRPTLVASNRGLHRSLTTLMNLDRQFIGNGSNALERPLGANASSFKLSTFDADITFTVMDTLTPRTAFVLAFATFFLVEPMKLDWIENMALIPTTGGHLAGFGREMASVENQGCSMPMANVRIDDLDDPMAA